VVLQWELQQEIQLVAFKLYSHLQRRPAIILCAICLLLNSKIQNANLMKKPQRRKMEVLEVTQPARISIKLLTILQPRKHSLI